MIQLKDAVTIAQSRMAELVPQATSLLLEEIELTNNEWVITLSFPDGQYLGLNIVGGTPRKYKTIIIDAETGDFKSMKIRHA